MNIKTKYSIGDTVWFMDNNKVFSGEVMKLDLTVYQVGQKETYWLGTVPVKSIDSSLIFPSKEKLIKSL